MDELGKDGGVGGHRHTLADRAPPLATMHRLLHKVFHVKPEGGGVSMSRRPSIVDSDGDYPVATRLRPPAVLPKSGCDAARTGPSCLYPAEPARPGSPWRRWIWRERRFSPTSHSGRRLGSAPHLSVRSRATGALRSSPTSAGTRSAGMPASVDAGNHAACGRPVATCEPPPRASRAPGVGRQPDQPGRSWMISGPRAPGNIQDGTCPVSRETGSGDKPLQLLGHQTREAGLGAPQSRPL